MNSLQKDKIKQAVEVLTQDITLPRRKPYLRNAIASLLKNTYKMNDTELINEYLDEYFKED
jgi:hypothetical protein